MTEFYFNDIHLLDIELSNRCNAACPMCARNIHGYSINPRLQLDELTLDDIKNIDKQYLDTLDTINISGNYGDPMICTEVVDIIKYFLKNTNAMIILNTNGGLRKPELWHMLGLLHPDRLRMRFAIDGLEDTNHIYRINVKWDKVIENAKAFIDAGGYASWRFLLFKHNQHQVEEASVLAKKLGFKYFKSIVTHRWRDNNFPVLDKHGKIMYNLTPTTVNKDEYKKFDHRKDGTLRVTDKIKSKGHGYLNKSYEKQSWKNFVNEEEKQPSLSCYASADNRIYIDANGYVFPCNNTGYIHGWANRYDYFADQIIEKLNQYTHTNIKNDNLSTILNGNWIKYIHETWQATTIKEGRFLMCSYTCSNQSPHKMIKDHTI
tara:strand:- start:521 stop:1648 length:1128 start_codon:yes stop_codon:yes gene_type:complete